MQNSYCPPSLTLVQDFAYRYNTIRNVLHVFVNYLLHRNQQHPQLRDTLRKLAFLLYTLRWCLMLSTLVELVCLF